jgi:hypothetical protein
VCSSLLHGGVKCMITFIFHQRCMGKTDFGSFNPLFLSRCKIGQRDTHCHAGSGGSILQAQFLMGSFMM